ncbi:C-type lectin domain-containing protein [Polyangium mundeleinium]|uniref:C-type lectin domain-containing protein n=1 Tax=Polyangium mundeleinium TaxID=2995306 RepID=A0ABT5EQF0_9BACT|nr:C-type lectin domain-containing protein [Polyangium mundeleinium]MDC0744068.1 C-type lectin domain-containing protein [Polyangium mundeleinium]
MLSTTRVFRSSLRSLLLAAPLVLCAAPIAGCFADAGAENEGFTDEDPQALVTETCNGVDDDGDERIDEDGICDCQTYVQGGHEYRVCQDQLDHAKAQAMCEGRGYGLARIENLPENTFLQPFAVGTQGYWIDLHDRVTEGDYRWSNGFSASFLNWSTDEPNNANNEDCGMMWDKLIWYDEEFHACFTTGKDGKRVEVPCDESMNAPFETQSVPPDLGCTTPDDCDRSAGDTNG